MSQILTPPSFRTSVTSPKIATRKSGWTKTIKEFKINSGVPYVKQVEPLVINESRKSFLQWYFRLEFVKRLYNPRRINHNYSQQELTDKLENR